METMETSCNNYIQNQRFDNFENGDKLNEDISNKMGKYIAFNTPYSGINSAHLITISASNALKKCTEVFNSVNLIVHY